MSGDDCEKLLHAVYTYLDGAVDDPEKAEIALHLRRCRGCHDAVEFERLFLQKIRTSCHQNQELPHGLVDRIQAVLRMGDSAVGDTAGPQSI